MNFKAVFEFLGAVVRKALNELEPQFLKWLASTATALGVALFGIGYAALVFDAEGAAAVFTLVASFVMLVVAGTATRWIAKKDKGK